MKQLKENVKPNGDQSERRPIKIRSVLAQLWQWRYRVFVLILLTLFVWYIIVPAILGPYTAVERVIRSDFIQSVVASGRVEAPFRVTVSSQITGVVTEIPVDEGQSVKTGDVLIKLDSGEAQAALIKAEGEQAQAEARLRQIRELTLPAAEETLKQAKATLLNAEQNFDRAQKLANKGYGTKALFDEATKALDVAKAQLRNAELQVYSNKAGGSEYVMMETQLRQAEANVAAAKSRLSYTIIKAPRDGILISRRVERGNVVQPSTTLMTLSPFVETQLVVQIDEKNLGLVKADQKAFASADAFADKYFPAEVAYINPSVDLATASVRVKLRVPNPPDYLRQDMTVSVDIETAKRPNATILSLESIRGRETGQPWVLKVNDGKAQRQNIKIGLTGSGKAEILDGLKDGDMVIPSSVITINEGDRLRPVVKAVEPVRKRRSR